MSATIRIGTRGSPLALWQARHVAQLLRSVAAGRAVELVEIETTGDRVRDRALSQIGGDGLFTIEDVFRQMSESVPQFSGLTLSRISDLGVQVMEATKQVSVVR